MSIEPARGAFAHALAAERARNAERIVLFRFVAFAAILVLNSAFVLGRTEFITAPTWALVSACAASAALLWLHRRSPRVARWNALALPFLDMPVALLLVRDVSEQLRHTAYASDAPATGMLLPLFFLVLILAASIALDTRWTWLTAGIGIVLQSAFLHAEGRDESFLAIVALASVFATSLGLYARRRADVLVLETVREQQRRERLGRYFSPQVAVALADSDAGLGAGEEHEVTVLFADIRNFTAMTERLRAPDVVRVLNRFHGAMVACVFAAGGTLDKFLGDGLMVYFGAPVHQSDHADRALRCGLAMLAQLERVNEALEHDRLPRLAVGIGIHSGRVIVGDIGSEVRREFTAIGDAVNVASRIEEVTKAHGEPILVSEETRRRASSRYAFIPVEQASLRGKTGTLGLFRVIASVEHSNDGAASVAELPHTPAGGRSHASRR